MPKAPVVTSDLDDQYIRNALLKLLDSMKRDRSKHITGSAVFNALSEEISNVQSLLTRFGG